MSTKLQEKTAAEAAERPIATYQTLIDNERTRITTWLIRPGEQTGWHRHEWDYVTYQQSTGRLHLVDSEGNERTIDYQPGVTMQARAPVEHNATNIGDVDIRVLEIEYKS